MDIEKQKNELDTVIDTHLKELADLSFDDLVKFYQGDKYCNFGRFNDLKAIVMYQNNIEQTDKIEKISTTLEAMAQDYTRFVSAVEKIDNNLSDIAKYLRAQTLIMASNQQMQKQTMDKKTDKPTSQEQTEGKDLEGNATSNDKHTPNMNEIHFDISG